MESLIYEYKLHGKELKIFGLGARRRFSQAAIEIWSDGVEFERVPRALWDFSLDPDSDEVAVDPASTILWAGEEYADIFKLFGCPEDSYERDVRTQMDVSKKLTKAILSL